MIYKSVKRLLRIWILSYLCLAFDSYSQTWEGTRFDEADNNNAYHYKLIVYDKASIQP